MNAGDIVEAEVVDVRENGLVLRAHGLDGFMNVTELAWTSGLVKPHEVAKIGQFLRVKIYAVTDSFFASLKQLSERVMPTLGSVHRGHVHSLVSFGVFVRLADGVIGLIRRDAKTDALAVADEVTVEVVSLQKIEFRLVSF